MNPESDMESEKSSRRLSGISENQDDKLSQSLPQPEFVINKLDLIPNIQHKIFVDDQQGDSQEHLLNKMT